MNRIFRMLSKKNLTGLILAGGAGRRVGSRDKGLIELDKQKLIQRQIDWLKPQVQSILISANRNIAEYQTYGYPVLPDKPIEQDQQVSKPNVDNLFKNHQKLDKFNGPLFGLMQGLIHCETSHLFVVPVDQPFLPVDTVSRLIEKINSKTQSMPDDKKLSTSGFLKTREREHYLCLLIESKYREDLRANLIEKNFRVSQFLKGCNIQGIDLNLQESQLANLNHNTDFQ